MRAPPGLVVIVLLASLLVAACEGGEAHREASTAPARPAQSTPPTVEAEYTSPFGYCWNVVDVDQPGPPYVGDPFPGGVFRTLADITGLPEDAAERQATPEFSWRCMDGFVYACTYGPNLPCGHADLSSAVTPEMVRYCQDHHPGTPLPGSIVGHQTIYTWMCQGETPATTYQKYQVDPRGFVAPFWHWIPEPEPAEPDRAEEAPAVEGAPESTTHADDRPD